MLHLRSNSNLKSGGPPRHFLDIDSYDTETLRHILNCAHSLKKTFKNGAGARPRLAEGLVLAMLFEKTSTRTRVSFDVAMRQLGGETIVLNHSDMQLGRGETIADTARVLSRYVDAIMMRASSHDKLIELAKFADIPVINGLSDRSHPCQILADVMTLEEKKGPLAPLVVTWVGDGNNVAASWIHAAVRFGFALKLATPKLLQPSMSLIEWARSEGGNLALLEDPLEAVQGADCVVTDVWVSMGQEATTERIELLKPYQVNAALMEKAAKDAIFMHCLPAQRGREVTDEVIDGPHSVVFDEAENRLHAQRALLAWCFGRV
ncbi:MAG TPA: ornithine carbamoyltransferase [Hyphomicrobiales bacterium]|nr:ornithine carbamoyltransferase [Hyphomicrobiales bacterium]